MILLSIQLSIESDIIRHREGFQLAAYSATPGRLRPAPAGIISVSRGTFVGTVALACITMPELAVNRFPRSPMITTS